MILSNRDLKSYPAPTCVNPPALVVYKLHSEIT